MRESRQVVCTVRMVVRAIMYCEVELMEIGGAGMELTGKGRRFVGGWVQGVAGTLFVGKSAERKLLFV